MTIDNLPEKRPADRLLFSGLVAKPATAQPLIQLPGDIEGLNVSCLEVLRNCFVSKRTKDLQVGFFATSRENEEQYLAVPSMYEDIRAKLKMPTALNAWNIYLPLIRSSYLRTL